jgi:ATP:corrinoid adenosyltransferase
LKSCFNRNEKIEVVLTGRKALPEIIKIADLVTEMVENKALLQRPEPGSKKRASRINK